jgi:hypothetical protein
VGEASDLAMGPDPRCTFNANPAAYTSAFSNANVGVDSNGIGILDEDARRHELLELPVTENEKRIRPIAQVPDLEKIFINVYIGYQEGWRYLLNQRL